MALIIRKNILLVATLLVGCSLIVSSFQDEDSAEADDTPSSSRSLVRPRPKSDTSSKSEPKPKPVQDDDPFDASKSPESISLPEDKTSGKRSKYVRKSKTKLRKTTNSFEGDADRDDCSRFSFRCSRLRLRDIRINQKYENGACTNAITGVLKDTIEKLYSAYRQLLPDSGSARQMNHGSTRSRRFVKGNGSDSYGADEREMDPKSTHKKHDSPDLIERSPKTKHNQHRAKKSKQRQGGPNQCEQCQSLASLEALNDTQFLRIIGSSIQQVIDEAQRVHCENADKDCCKTEREATFSYLAERLNSVQDQYGRSHSEEQVEHD